MTLLELISYFIQLLFIGTVTYAIGHFVLSMFISSFERNFLFYSKLFVGVILFVSTYALIKSHFYSYLIIVLPLAVLLIYFFSASFSLSGYRKRVMLIDLNNVLLLYGFLFTAFILACTKVLTINLELFELHPDFSYYSAISEILHLKGVESNYFDVAQIGERHYTFYHYFESWLNAFLFELSSNPGLLNLMLVVFPFFVALSSIGTYFLLKAWSLKNADSFLIFFLSFSILFVAPFIATIRWLFDLPSGEVPWNTSILSSQSIKSVVVIFGLNFCFLVYKYYRNYFAIAFLILGIIYPSLLVVIISSLIFWFVWIYRASRNEKWYQQSLILTITFVISLVFVLFINHNKNIYTSSITALSWEYFSTDRSRLINVFKEPVLRTIWMVITYSPFLLIGFLLYRENLKVTFKKHYGLFLFLGIAYILGSLGITLVDFLVNSDQLFKNLFEPLFVLMITFILFKGLFVSREKIIRGLSFCVLLGSFFFSLPDITTNRDVMAFDYKRLAGVLAPHLQSVAYINGGDKGAYNIHFQIPYYNLRQLTNGYFPHCLSVDRVSVNTISDRAYALNYINNSMFFSDKIKQKETYEKILDKYGITAVLIENIAIEIESFKSNSRYKYYHFEPYSLFVKVN